MKTSTLVPLFFTAVVPLAHGANSLLPLADTELAEVTGQALVEVQKIIGNGADNGDVGLSFTRIRLGIKAEVNANIDLVEMGNYNIPSHGNDTNNTGYYSTNKDGLDADLRIRNVSLGCLQSTGNVFGTYSCSGGPEPIRIEKPYIELAYKGDGTVNEELVGLRIGFEKLDGWLGGDIESISGHLYGQSGILSAESKAARSASITDGAFNIAWDLSLLHRLKATNTRNFFFGLQKVAINYPRATGFSQITAQPGFWVNLRDGITVPADDISNILFAPRLDNCWKAGTFC